MADVKWSQFPSVTPSNSDEVVGLHSGGNVLFSIANIVAAVRNGLENIFVPLARTINGKGLSSDITLDSSDIDYDNTGSGLTADNVQDALDELAQGGGGGSAADITYDPTTSGASATNVQDALDEAFDDLDDKQDAITASGILKGDGAGGVIVATAGTDYQVPLTIDATPTENSTNPVKSGGVYTDVRTRVPNYGKGKNLLRNWYFVGGGTGRGVFPVNQRGQSSYTGAVYGIDRWYVDSTLATITLSASGVSITSPQNSYFTQYLSNPQQYAEKTLTFTVWSSGYARMRYNINGTWNLVGVSPGISTVTFTLPSSVSTFGVQFGISGNSINTFYAVKLELGTEQTLAHQENGVWVLNEIPDYEYELYRCMTSTADSSDTYANKSLATEQQLGYSETGTTASRNYSAGEYICWNGLTYTANQAIPSGTTLNAGTGGNLTECVGGGLNATRPKQVEGITLNTNYVDGSNVRYTPSCVVSNGIAIVGGGVNIKSSVPTGIVLADGFPLPKGVEAFISAYNSNTGESTLVRVIGGENAFSRNLVSVFPLTKQSGITVYYLVGSYEIAEGG